MAYKKVQFKRGAKTGMPVLRNGEPGFTQDEKSLYIGDGTSNQRFLNETQLNTRIDEKIAPVTQFITNNIATLNQTINTKEEALDTKIGDKVKIDNAQTNVNFIGNKVTQDGLVDIWKLNTTKLVSNNFVGTQKETLLKKPSNATVTNNGMLCTFDTGEVQIANRIETLTLGFRLPTHSGNGIVTFGQGGILNKLEIYPRKNSIAFLIGGETQTTTITREVKEYEYLWVFNDGVKVWCATENEQVEGVVFPSSMDKSVRLFRGIFHSGGFFGEVSELYVYNRILTPQEIKHNTSIINNTPSINRINDYAISTDTDHIEDRTGRVQDTINRVFYKNMCKEFTSDGSPITVNNGMDGYVLSGMVQGNTVKCIYADDAWITRDVTQGYAEATVFIERVPQLKPNTTYVLICEISENTRTDRFRPSLSTSTRTFNETVYVDALKTGVFKFVVSTKSDFTGISNAFTSISETSTLGGRIVFRRCLFEVTDVNKVNSFLPFGLHSSQTVVSNNGLKYSFYKDSVDKASGTVIDLGGLDGARNTFEIKEDGSAVYTQNTKEKILNGEETWEYFSDGSSDVCIHFQSPASGYDNSSKNKYICDNFPNAEVMTWGSKVECVDISTISKIGLALFRTRLSTQGINGLKEYLKLNPFTIRYIIKTPIVTTIPRELVPTILTQLQNEFNFGDVVVPYKVTVQVPVNKVADLETRLGQLEKVIASTSNVSLLSNYVDDEYNKNQNKESEMI